MPCVGCEKECKCTAEKCGESCKCNSPGKCGCNGATNVAQSTGASCCQPQATAGGKTEKGCCKNNTKK